MDHFKGKQPLEHVIEALQKGKVASQEVHGEEIPGYLAAGADAAKESAFGLAVLLTLFPKEPHLILLIFALALLIWKTGRSALLGFSRLERLHRLIEEERYEIEHHRPQEKEELRALYAAKGFSGKLLDEVVEVLMADDNRLLQVMLEEELGLALEANEYPLKQAFGAFAGVLLSTLCLALGLFALPSSWGLYFSSALVIGSSAALYSRLQKNRILPSVIWNLGLALVAALGAHFLKQFLTP